jgi:molybdopterin molybdotransferase
MPTSPLRPVAEARQAILARLSPMPVEQVSLAEAFGRILAADLPASLSHPAAAVSAMDGWAVRAGDVASLPALLPIAGESGAGHPYPARLPDGQAVRIFTGALLPEGADTIIIQEEAEKQGSGKVLIQKNTPAGRYIRPAGMDFTAGDRLLAKGERLGARHIALAALGGLSQLPVYQKPRLAILTSGDELVPPGQTPGPGQLINSNSLLLELLARDAGAEPVNLGILPDRAGALGERLGRAEKPDMIVTTGGASVGDHDHIVSDLKANPNASLDFWKIAMRPGKPLIFGHWHGIPLLGLPGNPVSAAVCAFNFLLPALAALQDTRLDWPVTHARLATPLPENDQREDYIRARLARDEAGGWIAHPASQQDSAMLKTLVEADGFIIRPPHAAACHTGSEVPVLRLPDGF